ncbi:MAG: DNA polymerase III subunit beta [Solirubrobacteraceae bacterium]
MKLTLPASSLLAELQTVTRLASTRSAVQALSGVMLSASPGSLELRATDLDVGVTVSTAAEVRHDGLAVIPSRLLLDVVRAMPEGEMTLELRPEQADVEIRSGTATFHLRTLRSEDFPPLPSPNAENAIRLPLNAFSATVATVVRAASRDETRPVLTGVLVAATGAELSMAATDSYRLSVKRTRLERAVPTSVEANIPARALQELTRIAGTQDGELTLSTSGGQIVFELPGAVLCSRLIDGQFPNFRQLLPDGAEHELRLATAEVSSVVRRVSLLAQKNAPLRLRFAEGELTVSAQTPDVGEALESLPVPFNGEPFEIGFNPDFLRDGLDSLATDDFVLKLTSPIRPGLIESPESGDFTYLIMPIRLT